jgi:hypothetical protein
MIDSRSGLEVQYGATSACSWPAAGWSAAAAILKQFDLQSHSAGDHGKGLR